MLASRALTTPATFFQKKRATLMFNGYEPQVGQMYAGMDLKKFF